MDHLFHTRKTAIKRTARIDLTVIGRHHVALFDDVLLADLKRIHMKLRGKFVHRGLHREQSLCRPVSTVRPGRHHVRVYNITHKPECLRLPVERDGFMPGKSDRCGTMFPVSARVGQRVHVDAVDDPVLTCTETHMDFHLMARCRGGHALLAGKDDL